MKKINLIFIFLFVFNFLNANETEKDSVKLNSDYVNKTIDDNFKNCLKEEKSFMDCDSERMDSRSKADIFEINYQATEQLIKDKALKKEILEKPYIQTKEEKEIDLAFTKCSKKANTIEDQKACVKKIIVEKNTKD